MSVSVGETECSALCADGTVWTWGARSGVSLEEHQDDPYYPPTQVLDQVVQLFGDLAVKEDGTLVRVWFDGDTCTAAPLMEHVAAVGSLYCGIQDPAMLVQGQMVVSGVCPGRIICRIQSSGSPWASRKNCWRMWCSSPDVPL